MTDRSMPRFFKQALSVALVAGVAGALGISRLAAQQAPEPEPFTKEARDESGGVLSGAVSAGQTVTYVLTYSPPQSGSTGAIKISDTLGPGQTYVADSIIAPPRWDWAAAPDFASGGTEEFTHPGFSDGNAFVMTIPGTGSSPPSTGGDGTHPIVIGSKVYAIFHHKQFKSTPAPLPADPSGALIYCWDAQSLAVCPGGWPKSLDSASTPGTVDGERTTHSFAHHFVAGSRIYYASARWDNGGTPSDASDDKTIPGLGCWETGGSSPDTPCNFIALPTSTPGRVEGLYNPLANNFNNYAAGIVGVSSATDPSAGRVFMLAGGIVYCVDVPTGSLCPNWTQVTLPTGIKTSGSNAYVQANDMVLEVSPSPSRLYVYAGGFPSVVTCLQISDGNVCAGWSDGAANAPLAGNSLSLQVDAGGQNTVGVCLHPAHGGLQHRCYGATSGKDSDAPELPVANASDHFNVLAAFHVPGTARVLYPNYANAKPICRDFSSGSPATCSVTDFAPMWWQNYVGGNEANSAPQLDYTYAVDPISPDKCLLGLGDGGILWRFERDGTYPAEDCLPEEYRETFRLEQFFCADMPTEAMWETIEIVNRPTELTGGTITVLDAQNNVLATIEVGSGNSYPLDIQTLGASSEVTLVFDPTYTKAPDKPFELHLTFSANRAQQICYKAVVEQCEDITNSATMTDGRGSFSASTTLGPVVGGECGGGGVNCLALEPSLALAEGGGVTLSIGGLEGLAGLSDLNMSVAVGDRPVTAAPQSMDGSSAVWALEGVAPGDVVTLSMQGTREGNGSVPGTDLCCNSTFTLVVDDDEPEKEEPESGGVDFGLEKGVNNATPPLTQFAIYVTNYGTTPAPATGTTVIDTVPPGLTFGAVNAPGWDCGPADQFPLEAGEQLICRYTGTETLNPGDSFPGIMITASVASGTTTFENCATVSPSEESGLVDSRLFNNEGCFSPEEGAHLPACDPATTTSPAGDCVCRFEDMIEVSDTMCGCPAGQTFVEGQGCEEGGGPEMSVPEEEPPACDPDTTKLEGGQCVCLFEGMTPSSATSCSCKEGETYYPGAGCRPTAPATPPAPPPTPPALSCDRDTTKAENGACVCLYPNMRRIDEETCGCKRGEELIPGVGCRPREVTPPPEERRMCDQITTVIDGDGCACRYKGAEPTSPTTCACPAGTTLDRSVMACVPQCREPLVLDKTLLICVPKCEEPMILNRETLKCECPEGMELEDGKCVEESSIFDDIDINIGIGIGGSGGRRDRGPEPSPSPSPGPVPGRP